MTEIIVFCLLVKAHSWQLLATSLAKDEFAILALRLLLLLDGSEHVDLEFLVARGALDAFAVSSLSSCHAIGTALRTHNLLCIG